jgi:hypothetical protein
VSGAVRSDEGDNYGDTPLSLKKINISAHVTATLADSLALFNESLSSYLGVNCSSGDGDEGVVDARLVCHCEDHIWRVIVQLFNTEYNKQVNICQCFTMKQWLLLLIFWIYTQVFQARNETTCIFNTEVKNIPESTTIKKDLEELKVKTLSHFDALAHDLVPNTPAAASLTPTAELERQLLAASLDEYIQHRLDRARLQGVLPRGGRKPWAVSVHSLFPPPSPPRWTQAGEGSLVLQSSEEALHAGTKEVVTTPSEAMFLPNISRSLKEFTQEMSTLSCFVKQPGVPSFFSRETYEALDQLAGAREALLAGPAPRVSAAALSPERCAHTCHCYSMSSCRHVVHVWLTLLFLITSFLYSSDILFYDSMGLYLFFYFLKCFYTNYIFE